MPQDPYVARYKNNANDKVEFVPTFSSNPPSQVLTGTPRKFLGRVEAKHDRIEKQRPVDNGHQTAIDELRDGVRRDKGWTKPERKQGFQEPVKEMKTEKEKEKEKEKE